MRGQHSRIRIPTKLVIAASPLLLAIGGLLGLTVRDSLDRADAEHRAAEIVAVWTPIRATIDAVEEERGRSGLTDADGSNVGATDAAVAELASAIASIGDPPQLVAELEQVTQGLADARAARGTSDAAAALSFNEVFDDLGQLGDLLPAIAADAELGRDLQALAALQHVRRGVDQVSDIVAQAVRGTPIDPFSFSVLIGDDRDAVAAFVGAAPADWLQSWNESPASAAIASAEDEYLSISLQDPAQIPSLLARTDMNSYRQSDRKISVLFDRFTEQIIADARAAESDARSESRLTIALASAAVLVALLIAWQVTRSITRRIHKVMSHARDITTTQLPHLVDALRDPRGRSSLPQSQLITGAGRDEVGELADSFNAMQTTLVGVAEEQMTVLRRGVSDIFVTLARRNRSLVDRQLVLLDALEADVDDPKVLGDYFQLDHLATRMRRNAESLLVLAHTETRRRRADPLPVDDVVRAAISEVEEYRRVDVERLDPVTFRGIAVADLAHMMAELIDNAAQFSPPTTRVAVSGRHVPGGYELSVVDRGMGVSDERLAELNDLLASPPVIGLSVEPTLGLSVVSLLAAKHGAAVRMSPASPGIVVTVLLPGVLIEGQQPPEVDRTYVDVPTHAPVEAVTAPLQLAPETRIAAELALTAPTPEPRLRRLDDVAELATDVPVDVPVDVRVAVDVPAGVIAAEDRTGEAANGAPVVALPVRQRAASTPDVAPSPAGVAADAPANVTALPVRPVTAPVAATMAPTAPAPSDATPNTSSPAGPQPNVVRGPAGMLDLGRPLLDARPTIKGLPLRRPGAAAPDVGGDERSVAVSQPDQVRANLAAFARGVNAAGSSGRSLEERVAAERAALEARSNSLRAAAQLAARRPADRPADTNTDRAAAPETTERTPR